MSQFMQEALFWGVWLIIPLMIDIVSGLISGVYILIKYNRDKKNVKELEFFPTVTIIIPVYNSIKTLKGCINSIANQKYPTKNMQIFLIDNGSQDNGKEAFYELQMENPKLKIWWLDSPNGKAKALNKGLYMADGKYIINIDSDGELEENSIFNLVYKFENNPDICAMTGVVLTNTDDIDNTEGIFKRLLQKCELFEYSEAFLVGRGYQSITDTMFTLAGACSAFRKDIVLRTQLYNGETLGEDTHMTSQIKEFFNGKVALCEDCFFIVDPIESRDKIYTQRQRWQRGQIEVSTLFSDNGLSKTMKLAMIKDHTLVFPRLIWMFAMIYLIFIDYPLKLIIGANIILYISYVSLSIFQYFMGRLYLKKQEKISKYMRKHFFIILLLPLYRIVLFFVRAAGIINAIDSDAKWNAKTLSEESDILNKEVSRRMKGFNKIKSLINSNN
ncbi:MAG: TIGR03111 family XrtG-associated glycosyltransferase [Clostridium sp.]